MEEEKKESMPFTLTMIGVFYGFMAFISVMGASEQYILFSVVLPPFFSKLVTVFETTVLIYITIGIFKKRTIARKVLIGYNAFAIADILFTLTFVDKEKLLELLKETNAVIDYANINLIFCLILFIILRFVRTNKQFFVNKSA
jgi:hypothetical protein